MTFEAAPESCKVQTPLALARAMVRALGDEPEVRWLEPSHGQGAFVSALADEAVPPRRIRALDLDQTAAPADVLATTSRGIDFLTWSAETNEVFDRIVGNPPYVPISRLPPTLRKTAAHVQGFDELPIGSCSNLWYAFVLRSLRLLRPGASVAFVLPSAVEYAEYAAPLRTAIRDHFEMLDVLRCRRPLFNEVQEGTVVVIARGYKNGPLRIRRREFARPERLIQSLEAKSAPKLKQCSITVLPKSSKLVQLSEIADISLGGVTGDSNFFLLTEAERVFHGLPKAACTPVVSKARHLKASVLSEKTWKALLTAGERVWLFRPTDKTINHLHVVRYLNLTPEEGGCNRLAFKVKSRTPWYRTPLPCKPDAFISGMTRYGPWMCMNDFGRLNATNTLYVVRFASGISGDERFGYALALLSSPVQRQLRKLSRLYADGLLKYEPGSLTKLQLPIPHRSIPFVRHYHNVLAFFLSGNRHHARQVADKVLGVNA